MYLWLMCDDFMYDVIKGLMFEALILIVDLNCYGNLHAGFDCACAC